MLFSLELALAAAVGAFALGQDVLIELCAEVVAALGAAVFLPEKALVLVLALYEAAVLHVNYDPREAYGYDAACHLDGCAGGGVARKVLGRSIVSSMAKILPSDSDAILIIIMFDVLASSDILLRL